MSDPLLPVYPILLAGGVGTRLWPVSRELFPKQLVRFFGDDSLIQATIKRLNSLVEPENIRIVCGREHTHEIGRHMHNAGIEPEGKIIREPCGRNTAPAILLGVLKVIDEIEDAIICVFPADHVIGNTTVFHEKVHAAVRLAEKGHIVTFGIQPNYPETGYGYIEGDRSLSEGALSIKRFVEKPDLATAKAYIADGRYFWNSGMFTFRASVMLEEFRRNQPEILTRMTEILDRAEEPSVAAYKRIESISIDYAIMENTSKGVVLPSDLGWSDIGSWKSLYDFIEKDDDHNVTLGDDIITRNTRNTFIMGQSRMIAVNNVRNLAIVETPDVVFVSDLENSRDVKSIVEDLKADNRQELYRHGTVFREWGSLTTLNQSDGFEVDRMEIFPGFAKEVAGDAEHTVQLVVAKGPVRVAGAGKTLVLQTGGSTAATPGDTVRLENPGESTAVVIRVKC